MKNFFYKFRKKSPEPTEDIDTPLPTSSDATDLIFGAKWNAALNNSPEELLALARSEDASVYYEIESNSQTPIYGFDRKSDAKTKRYVAAAALYFYSEEKSKAYIYPINVASVALIIINDGVPTFDEIIQPSEAISLLLEQVASWRDSGNHYAIFGSLEGITISPDDVALDVAFLSPIELRDFAKEREIFFKPIKGKSWLLYLVILSVILVVAMIIAVAFDSEIFNSNSQKEKTPAELHAERIQQKINEIRNAKSFPRQTAQLMNPFLLSVPWKLKGWEFMKANCPLKTNNCELTYKRLTNGTAKDLLDAFKVQIDQNIVQFTSLDTGIVTVQHPTSEKVENLEISFLNDFSRSFMSWLQLLTDAKYRSMLTQATYVVPPPNGVKFPKEQLIKSGDFEFSIPKSDIDQLSKIPNYLVIENIDVQISNTENKMPEFSYKGKYYAY